MREQGQGSPVKDGDSYELHIAFTGFPGLGKTFKVKVEFFPKVGFYPR
jgi:predicted RNA-binding protein with TRAM domain